MQGRESKGPLGESFRSGEEYVCTLQLHNRRTTLRRILGSLCDSIVIRIRLMQIRCLHRTISDKVSLESLDNPCNSFLIHAQLTLMTRKREHTCTRGHVLAMYTTSHSQMCWQFRRGSHLISAVFREVRTRSQQSRHLSARSGRELPGIGACRS